MPSFAPGAVLGGRYRLERRVADDGLTELWTAADGVLARPVLVEAVSEGAGADAEGAFREAAGAAGRLVHSAIVATYDTGTIDGRPYIVTERPGGPTLAELVDRSGPLSAARVVLVGRQVARALQVAHRNGVVHGGVSPMTVMVGEDDRAKLGRFAACGARARLSSAGGGMPGDVRACAATLLTALAGTEGVASARAVRPGVPPALDALLTATRDADAPEAGALAVALDGIEVADDAVPLVPAEPTPPMGTRMRPPPSRALTSRTGAIAGVVVGGLLAVAVAVAAFVLMSRGGSSGGSGGGPGTTAGPGEGAGGTLAIATAASFNPLGSGTEHPEALGNLTDGNPSTLWSTQTYNTRTFGGLKSGDGVDVTLNGVHPLQQLTVTSPSRGWTFSVYVSAGAAPSTLGGWGRPVAGPTTVESDVTPVSLGGVRGDTVLVWITQLSSSAPYRVDIGELSLR